jgi:hypothetical protein
MCTAERGGHWMKVAVGRLNEAGLKYELGVPFVTKQGRLGNII